MVFIEENTDFSKQLEWRREPFTMSLISEDTFLSWWVSKSQDHNAWEDRIKGLVLPGSLMLALFEW